MLQINVETRVGLFVLIAIVIFVYMGFKIGSFRFDRSNYVEYTLSFDDISGLSRKSDVKIAGVKVGWVESVALVENKSMPAQAIVMVHNQYKLYQNAHGVVRQDGFLGPKYIEISPGDPGLMKLQPGSQLHESVAPVSVDELMREFKHIAVNVRDVTDSFKDAIGGDDAAEKLQMFVQNITAAADRLSSFTGVLERSFVKNEDHIDALLQLGTTITQVANTLQNDVLPGFQGSIDRIANVFDRDFSRIASHVETVAQSVDEAVIEARDGLHSISSVATKINEGTGLIGKLINEDETYRDIKVAVEGIRNYVTKLDRMQIVFDLHSEKMQRPAENYLWEDCKGYFEARIYPREDYFFLVQYMQTEKGFLVWSEKQKDYLNRQDREELFPDQLHMGDGFRLLDTVGVREQKINFNRDAAALGIQLGKVFGDIALRVGLFDGYAGMGADVDIPIRSERFRWVTTLELFDMNGRNRIDDRRPHLKWFNKMYFMQNLYVVFGADDFASKRNASAFYGVGLRFGDDDVKYLMGSFAGLLGNIAS